MSYEFDLNSGLQADAIQFFAKDANDAFVPGITFSLSDPSCGTLGTATVETDATSGEQYYEMDFTPPAQAPDDAITCQVIATDPSADPNVNCPCDIVFSVMELDCTASEWGPTS